MKPLCYWVSTQGDTIIVERSDGMRVEGTGYEIIDALLLDPEDNYQQFFWELDQALATLLPLFGEEACRSLYQTKRAFSRPYKLYHIPGKLVEIKRGRQVATFYDMEQYFPTEQPRSAGEMQALADELVAALRQLGMSPKRFTSPATILRETQLDHMVMPDWIDLPEDVIVHSFECAAKLWTEAHVLGHWDASDVYDYDIIAAFPAEAARVLDTTQFRWEHATDWDEKARYGYVFGEMTINAPVSPIIWRNKWGELFNPVGSWWDWFTVNEVRFVNHWVIGSFHFQEGYFGYPRQGAARPMQALMERLYNAREHGGLTALMAKRMAASFYGLTLQANLDNEDIAFGQYFNPVWGAEISTNCRLRVAHFIYHNGVTPIHIGVDGVLSPTQVEIPPDVEMGKWKVKSTDAALVMASGLVYQGKTHPGGMYYEDVVEMMREQPQGTSYSKVVRRRITLGQAMAGDDFASLGREVPMSNSVSVQMARDRDFGTGPRRGIELMTGKWGSQPYHVSSLAQRRKRVDYVPDRVEVEG